MNLRAFCRASSASISSSLQAAARLVVAQVGGPHHGRVTDPASTPSPEPRTGDPDGLDPQVLRARLEAATDFPGAMREAMQDAIAAGGDAVAANQESLKGYDDLMARTMSAIEKELDKPDLTPAERRALIDQMIALVERRDMKDTENKGFLVGLTQDRLRTGLLIAGGLGAVAVAAVAGPDSVKQLAKLAPGAVRRSITS